MTVSFGEEIGRELDRSLIVPNYVRFAAELEASSLHARRSGARDVADRLWECAAQMRNGTGSCPLDDPAHF